MSEITQIRSMIQDQPLYQKEVLTLDGTQKSFQVYFFPMVASSVIITATGSPVPSSVDEQNGVLRFASALPTSVTVEYSHVSLLDSTIQDFIDTNDDGADIRLPAADALDAIADQQALILKKLKLLDLETDGPAVAEAMRAHATALRKLVFEQSESTFDVGELVYGRSTYEEKVVKDWMRGA